MQPVTRSKLGKTVTLNLGIRVERLTSQITDAAPVMLRMKTRHHRGVRCICFVKPGLHGSAKSCPAAYVEKKYLSQSSPVRLRRKTRAHISCGKTPLPQTWGIADQIRRGRC